ncbi:MAG: hypothetical protein ABSC06_34255 [Rhodopila sp.]|jgi:hypothetical protein
MAGDPRVEGPLSAIAVAFADEAAAQSRRPPHMQRHARAGYGAALLSGCYCTLDLCGPLARGPLDPLLRYAWWGCAALGVYWLLAGLFGRARGPVMGGGFMVAVDAVGAGWLLWNRIYPAGLPNLAALLHGIYLAALCGAVAQIAAVMIGRPGDARIMVTENIDENEFDWEQM